MQKFLDYFFKGLAGTYILIHAIAIIAYVYFLIKNYIQERKNYDHVSYHSWNFFEKYADSDIEDFLFELFLWDVIIIITICGTILGIWLFNF